MKFKKEFLELVEKSIDKNQYVGLGNPNSKILLIGKEPGFDPMHKSQMQEHIRNAMDWKEQKENLFKNFTPDRQDKQLRNYNHTWQKYQKIYDCIFNDCIPPKDYKITFIEKIFTTELSNLPARKSTYAKRNKEFKTALLKRKNEFFKSDFIQQFPIVIIAALDPDYIKKEELDEKEEFNLFDVKFSYSKEISSKNKYYVHYSMNGNNPKLLIHTRQFSNGISDLLIKRIANEIQIFAKENGIYL